VADDTNAYKKHDLQPKVAQAAKKRSRLSVLIILLIPVLGAVLPMPYKALAPFLFLIPMVISAANKLRQVAVQSVNSPPNQNYSMPLPKHDHSVKPYLCAPQDPKDPRQYKPT